jgi:hypothetical protein
LPFGNIRSVAIKKNSFKPENNRLANKGKAAFRAWFHSLSRRRIHMKCMRLCMAFMTATISIYYRVLAVFLKGTSWWWRIGKAKYLARGPEKWELREVHLCVCAWFYLFTFSPDLKSCFLKKFYNFNLVLNYYFNILERRGAILKINFKKLK